MFNSLFTKKTTPKDVAKDRLKLILIHDRGELSPDILDKIKEEILGVLNKYIDIEMDDMDIAVTKPEEVDGDSGAALVANIPIKNLKGR